MITYDELPANARVWIYQSNQAFTEEQTTAIRQKLQQFIDQWQSHGAPVKGWAGIKYNRFIIIIADENHEAPSGCSIDSSVAVVKEIEAEMSVDMFDRLNFAYKTAPNTVLSANRGNFANLYASKTINDNTIVFNNLVATKADLETKWEVPLVNSWHINMV